ncbi:hypothetical protein H8959_002122 [Pygathrix nigripes]
MLEALCKTALTSCIGGEERVFLAAEAGPFSPVGAEVPTAGWKLELGSHSGLAFAALTTGFLLSPGLGFTVCKVDPKEWPLTFMGSQTKRVLLNPLTHPARPFRVSNHDRSSRRGVMASSLQELISKTLDALVITTGLVTLVLEEDGTVVDTEEFFQTLGDNTHFMILEKGQKWMLGSQRIPTCSPPKRSGIARVTFDLYRLNPKDFIGCLNVKATMYEMYSVSYDIRCTGLKGLLRSLLRFLSYSAQVTGQFLVYMGTYMLRVLDDKSDHPSGHKPRAASRVDRDAAVAGS